MSRQRRGEAPKQYFLKCHRRHFVEQFPLGTPGDAINLFGRIVTGSADVHSVSGYMKFTPKGFLRAEPDFPVKTFEKAWAEFLKLPGVFYHEETEILLILSQWKNWLESPTTNSDNLTGQIRRIDGLVSPLQPREDEPLIFPFRKILWPDIVTYWRDLGEVNRLSSDVEEILDDMETAIDPVTYEQIDRAGRPGGQAGRVDRAGKPGGPTARGTDIGDRDIRDTRDIRDIREGSISSKVERAFPDPKTKKKTKKKTALKGNGKPTHSEKVQGGIEGRKAVEADKKKPGDGWRHLQGLKPGIVQDLAKAKFQNWIDKGRKGARPS